MMAISFLSHVLREDTPLYGGEKEGVRIRSLRAMTSGDTCNSLQVFMPCHGGTHVDLPSHFVSGGATVEDYPAARWIFHTVGVIYLAETAPCQPLGPDILMRWHGKPDLDQTLELLLLKTGFGRFRDTPAYWESGPIFLSELADAFRQTFPNLRAVGMDTISLSSWADRVVGRQAHRQFLGGERPLLLIEDMDLDGLTPGCLLDRVVVAPLRIRQADGVPVTVFAEGTF